MPTIVTLIEKKTNVSLFYSFDEEEIHKNHKEIKSDFKRSVEYFFMDSKRNPNSKIISENLSRHNNVGEEIFFQPPELN